jgi:alkylhydroperoxidase family enzyme
MPDRLRATLELLAKVTLEPERVGAGDVDAARSAGVSDAALADALHVCALFNTIVRIADGLGFDVPGPEVFAADAPGFYERGYG